jgi:adenylosuccinate lyase
VKVLAMATNEHDREMSLMAVTPTDGRYRSRTRALEAYFSEYALIQYRMRIEVEWYLTLAAHPKIDAIKPIAPAISRKLRALYSSFTVRDAMRIKEIESETNHDVKAVEYFLKERLPSVDEALPLEMMHFACTSEDINNTAYALILKEFAEDQLMPKVTAVMRAMAELARRFKDVPMLSRTHGQEASPTTVGKEMAIFASRVERQLKLLHAQEYLGKFNGAVGNFNAHAFAYPEVDWIELSKSFVESLGLVWNPLTTQIESHDFIAEMLATVARIDTILLGFCRDMWSYISIGYFRQRSIKGETGSSVMPHKVNPIDFENAEGNFGIANALFEHLIAKLPISRWQRDLSDSTSLRALGPGFGHAMVALSALEKGLTKVEIDEERIAADVDAEESWEVVSEAIQTMLRRHGYPRPYETLKELTRGRDVDQKRIQRFIESLDLKNGAREALKKLAPRNYTGLAAKLVELYAPAAETSSKHRSR